MKELAGKTAVVTGAASGIGRALAERFVAEKMKVVLADLDGARLEEAAREIGGEVLAVPTDVSRGASVEALAARAEEAFGAVHILCNNAGVGGGGGPIWMLSEKDWQWTLSVNLWGVIHGIRVFVPRMLAHGDEAHVVNTASLAGLGSPAFLGPYVASKHAVVSLSEVLARDLQAVGARVRASVLCPHFVRTNIFDSERSRPEELRNAGEANAVQQQLNAAVRKLIDAGSPPSEIAEHVVAALHDGRFYILPHPALNGMIEQRMRDILDGRYPKFDPSQLESKRNPQST
jgi:NAD(P)-dependent dehydrogenase (short-subunit alcohol dehydrogenase family)